MGVKKKSGKGLIQKVSLIDGVGKLSDAIVRGGWR